MWWPHNTSFLSPSELSYMVLLHRKKNSKKKTKPHEIVAFLLSTHKLFFRESTNKITIISQIIQQQTSTLLDEDEIYLKIVYSTMIKRFHSMA